MKQNSNRLKTEWLFVAAHKMHKNRIKSEMALRGLGQFSSPHLLLFLSCKTAPIAQREISSRLGISPAAVTVSVQRMEKAGLLRKVMDENDQRCNKVQITEQGRVFAKKCQELMKQIDEGMYRGFSSEEFNELGDYLMRIVNNLSAMGAPVPNEPCKTQNEDLSFDKKNDKE